METQRRISHAKRKWYDGYYSEDMTTQSDIEMADYGGIVSHGTACSTIVLEPSSPNIFKDHSRKKYLWTTGLSTIGLPAGKMAYFIYEIPEQVFGFTVETVASMSPWPDVLHYNESDRFWRGVFSPYYRRKVLFSQEVQFKATDLPKWHPKVFIDRRTIQSEDI